jgi:hypothetical protein
MHGGLVGDDACISQLRSRSLGESVGSQWRGGAAEARAEAEARNKALSEAMAKLARGQQQRDGGQNKL